MKFQTRLGYVPRWVFLCVCDVYVSFDTGDHDPGAGLVDTTPWVFGDCFVQKLESNGDFWWVKPMGGIGLKNAHGAAVNLLGDADVTGYFDRVVGFLCPPPLSV